MAFRVTLRGETAHFDLEALMGRRPPLRELHGNLADRYYKVNPAGGRAAAEARATGALERLVSAAIRDVGGRFAAEKGSILEKILTARRDIHEIYTAILEQKGKAATPKEIGEQFQKLRALLKDVRERPEETAAKPGDHPELDAERKRIADELAPTPKPAGAKTPVPAEAGRLTSKGFRRPKGKSYFVKKYTRGVLKFFIEGGVFRVESTEAGKTTTFSEFDTLAKAYKDKPLSSRVMQAHHGCQDALMEALFKKYGYDGAEAPTIWLRNSTGESPHGRITHELQNPSQASRLSDPDLSYAKIREWGVADLKRIGAPPEKIAAYLDTIDKHFRDHVLPNIQAAVRRGELTPARARALVGGNLFP